MPAIRVASKMVEIVNVAKSIALQNIQENQTFAVRARRVGTQEYTSKDVEIQVGAEVLKQLEHRRISVNLDEPDVTLFVEVRNDAAFIYHNVVDGPGGLPFGSQGRLVCLFSGGIDSPVAAWLMMKRGATVELLFLDQRPYVGDNYAERARIVAGNLRRYIPKKELVLNNAPFGEIMSVIASEVPEKNKCIICKRMMYRVACSFAEKKQAEGIITGESLGQVASQTLFNLRVLDEVSTFPVFRPLIGFNKREIVDLAKDIKTYESSILSIQSCSVVPSKPTTKAKIVEILEIERDLPVTRLVADAVERITLEKA
jgi:thiamine biosynthesis protein ThiI